MKVNGLQTKEMDLVMFVMVKITHGQSFMDNSKTMLAQVEANNKEKMAIFILANFLIANIMEMVF